MNPVSTCCTRITNVFKHGRYSNRSNAFKQHGRFGSTCYWRICCNEWCI